MEQKNPLGELPVPVLLRRYALPSILAMLVSALYNIVDQFFIGRSVGELGNAATNVAFPLSTSCVALALLFGIGGAAAFNLTMGKGEKEKALFYIGNAATMLFLSGVVLTVITELFLESLLVGFGSPQNVLSYAKTYTGITAIGFPFLILSAGGGHLIRADGSPSMAMISNLAGAVINTVLDALFVFGFNMGMQGAALATAIIEKVRRYGALCAATTHYAEMKAYALETDGVTNASCEFDVETLRPTYRLIIGTPGKSNAFAISSKLGIDDDIIEAAKDRLSNDNRRFENVIEELEKNRIEAERERDAAIKEHREYEAFRNAEEAKLKKKAEIAERELEKAQERAAQILQSAKVTSEFVLGQLDDIKKKQESGRFAEALEEGRRSIRKSLRETEDRVNPVIGGDNSDYVLPRPLKKGDTVLIVNLNQRGMLTDSPDRNGNVSVKAGLMNMKTNIKNLRLAGYVIAGIQFDKSLLAFADRRKSIA